MVRILVTGGCGFIGANFVAHTLANGSAQVRVFDNQSTCGFDSISDLDVDCVAGDIRDRPALARAMTGAGAVVHLAADTGVVDSIARPLPNLDTNVIGTVNVLETARELGVKTVVSASTAGAIVGDARPPVTEDMPPRPLSPYGASKLAAEAYCSAYAGSYGLETVSLRFTNVYGRRSRHKNSVVARFFKRILAGKDLIIYGDGSQRRDFLSVDDLCASITRCLAMSESLAGQVLQLGSGTPVSINELVALMRVTVGGDHPFSVRHEAPRTGEVRNSWADVTKAARLLDFRPETPLADGLAETWRWFASPAIS